MGKEEDEKRRGFTRAYKVRTEEEVGTINLDITNKGQTKKKHSFRVSSQQRGFITFSFCWQLFLFLLLRPAYARREMHSPKKKERREKEEEEEEESAKVL